MNPLLFANLSNQRRLLESVSAYAAARLVVHIVFDFFGVVSIAGCLYWLKVDGDTSTAIGMPSGETNVIRALIVLMALMYAGALYVGWVVAQAFFDIADACLAVSLQGPKEEALPEERKHGPRAPGGSWPEAPKPLIPTAPAVRPEDAKYLPKG